MGESRAGETVEGRLYMMDDSLIRNEVCGDAQPKLVLHFFEEICKIPHGSFHVQELSDWLVSFAKDRKLAYTQDKGVDYGYTS